MSLVQGISGLRIVLFSLGHACGGLSQAGYTIERRRIKLG